MDLYDLLTVYEAWIQKKHCDWSEKRHKPYASNGK